MRKIKCLISLFLCLLFLLIPSLYVEAENSSPSLAPYMEAVKELNAELNSTIRIPSAEELEAAGFDPNAVYSQITSVSVSTFKSNLKREYSEVAKYIDGSGTFLMEIESCDTTPISLRDITTLQRCYLNYGAVYLESTITVGATHFYTSIVSLGSLKYTDRTHFRASNVSYVFRNNRRDCDVTYTGSLYTASGVMLTDYRKYYITYTAGAGDSYVVTIL